MKLITQTIKKMVILWLGLSVIPAVYYWHLTKESHAFLLENMVSQGEQFLSFVDERASNQYAQDRKTFHRLSHSILLKDFALSGDDKLREYLLNQWVTTSANSKFFYQLRYLDTVGQEIIRVDYTDKMMEPYVVPANELQFKGERDYFLYAKQLTEGEIGYFGLDIEYEHGKPVIPYLPGFRIIYPIDDHGQRLGYFIANLNVMNLISIMTANTQQFSVDFVDHNGDFLLSSDTKKLFGQLVTERAQFNLRKTNPDLWQKIQDTPLQRGSLFNQNGMYIFRPFYTRLFETPGGLTLITLIPQYKIQQAFASRDQNVRSDTLIMWILIGIIAGILALLWETYLRNHEAQTFNRVVMDNSGAVVMTDEDQRILQANSRFCQMINKEPVELQGQFISDIQLSAAKYRTMQRQLKEQSSWSGELLIKSDEAQIVCKVDAKAISGKMRKVRYYVYSFNDISDQHQAILNLKEESERDPGTALWNKKKFNQTLSHYSRLQERYRDSEKFTLAIIDIDNFKQINDNYGHDIGDKVILLLATKLTSLLRDTDFISRIGGDEFAVILQHVDTHTAFNMMERIAHAIQADAECLTTVSIGLADITANHKQSFINADKALYRSKNKGKNCVSAHGFEQFRLIDNAHPD